MGYSTHYKLSVVGTSDVLVTPDNKRAIGKSADPEYLRFVHLLEEVHENRNKKKSTAEAFAFAKKVHMEIPVDWLYDFWCHQGEPCKWYGHERDMTRLAKAFPTLVFKLEGEGEESGDLWIKYFKGDKIQKCYAKITFDDFNEKSLQLASPDPFIEEDNDEFT